ncbi:MAG: hypothetical protein GX488_01745, partial [Clostridiales bacterium]|nr:hypothetical protein [Clostridiales bacterium]
DTKIASAAAEAIEDLDLNSEVWLLNVDASYVKDGNFYFHEHDYGVTSSSWALTGAVRAISGRGKIPQITPVSVYRAFETDEDKIAKANAFWYDGMVFTRAVFRKSSNGVWSIFDKSGKALGTMSYSDGAYMLKAK